MSLLQILPDPVRENAMVCVIFVLGFPLILFYLFPVFHGLLISPTRNIPGPIWARVTRWWEYQAVLKDDSHIRYIRLHEKYGSIVRVGPNRYSFSRPEDVKIIYEIGSKFIKTEYYDTLSPSDPAKRNLFTIRDQDVHKDRRRKISTLYTMSSMVSYEEAVDKMTNVCIRKMRQFAEEERVFSVPDFMQYYAFDVIGEITFNQNFSMMEKEGDNTEMVKGIHEANDYLAYMGLVPDLHPWNTWLRILLGKEPNVAALVRYTLNQLAKHREENAKESKNTSYDSFLSKLLKLEAENRVNMSNIMDACGSNIGAGSDTTAITLSAALYHLYRNPEKLAKLRHEIDSLAGDGQISDPVTFQQAQGMPYLQAVIKETLRIHPAVGTILARKVPTGGAELGGIHFPEGTDVGANPWVLHYNKEIYGQDADQYKPERWIKDDKGSLDLKDSMMFAFGSGSRTCIGKNISLLEMTKLVPQIVRNLDIVFDNPSEPMKMRCAWFVYPKYKAQVKLRVSS